MLKAAPVSRRGCGERSRRMYSVRSVVRGVVQSAWAVATMLCSGACGTVCPCAFLVRVHDLISSRRAMVSRPSYSFDAQGQVNSKQVDGRQLLDLMPSYILSVLCVSSAGVKIAPEDISLLLKLTRTRLERAASRRLGGLCTPRGMLAPPSIPAVSCSTFRDASCLVELKARPRSCRPSSSHPRRCQTPLLYPLSPSPRLRSPHLSTRWRRLPFSYLLPCR